MLDIGWSELLLVAVVIMVIFGPKELPKLLANWRRVRLYIQRMSQSFRQSMETIANEADFAELSQMPHTVASELKDQLKPLYDDNAALAATPVAASPLGKNNSSTDIPPQTNDQQTNDQQNLDPSAQKNTNPCDIPVTTSLESSVEGTPFFTEPTTKPTDSAHQDVSPKENPQTAGRVSSIPDSNSTAVSPTPPIKQHIKPTPSS